MNIGERIKAARKRRRLSQLQLALLLGYREEAPICKWERGAVEPKLYNLARIADALKLTTTELFACGTLTPREESRYAEAHSTGRKNKQK